MANRADITPELLRQLLRYEPDTGKLFWLERLGSPAWNGKNAGKEAFTYMTKMGYKTGTIMGKFFRSHRVAWAMHYGVWPYGEIDHIDGNKSNNAVSNLRSVSGKLNCRNMPRCETNKSGHTGVYRRVNSQKWVAQIRVDGKAFYLGSYDNVEDAVSARKLANIKNGFHPNHGRA